MTYEMSEENRLEIVGELDILEGELLRLKQRLVFSRAYQSVSAAAQDLAVAQHCLREEELIDRQCKQAVKESSR
jgi:hypothetical protein